MIVHASIKRLEYVLPDQTLTNDDLGLLFGDIDFKKLSAKTGIETRHIAGRQRTIDLAYTAALKLFESDRDLPNVIDYLLLCTQSPEYVLPATACLLQDRLGLSSKIGSLDFNLGCSGFVYGLGLAEGLIASGQAKCVLLITADTMTSLIDPGDARARALFGDGAAAILLVAQPRVSLGPFVYGTDGKGSEDLIVRRRRSGDHYGESVETVSPRLITGSEEFLFMNGNRVFDFAIREVPLAVRSLLHRSGAVVEDIDLYVFHQANKYLLEEICRLLEIPMEKRQFTISHCGNTSASSIPIALRHAALEGRLRKGSRAMVVGFGSGYSWGATIIRWAGQAI
jgi:3-oxoacyl-[acyl-carrier-protein] synthase-3